MDANSLINAMIAYSVEHYSQGVTADDLLIHATMVAMGVSEIAAEQWLSERMEDVRVAMAD